METLVGRCHCGAVVAMVPLERLRVIKGEENLTLYRWNMRIAKHFGTFCFVAALPPYENIW
jgi:hypothetical protein